MLKKTEGEAKTERKQKNARQKDKTKEMGDMELNSGAGENYVLDTTTCKQTPIK